jgi:peptide/nickel transport system ATP-binding protein
VEENNLIEVRNLEINFGSAVPLVKSISFDIRAGEVLGIVGESGSGKSITCLSIIRLLSDAATIKGDIMLNGESLSNISEAQMVKVRGKEISMIFQEPMSSLNPTKRCGNQVREAILIHQNVSKEEAKTQVLQLFKEVSLPDVERIYNAYPHQISGGQIQRVMIAMAIANHPKLIIADEPTTALDATVQNDIVNLLKKIKSNYNSSIVFISHDLGVVRNIADRVLVMKKGEIVERGPVEDIFTHPNHPYTKGLLACRPPLDYRLYRLPTVHDYLTLNEEQIKVKLSNYVIKSEDWKLTYQKLENKHVLLDVKDLNKWYTVKRDWLGKPKEVLKALNNVTFQVRSGEVLGLVGESGSGKTTCGRTLLKLISPTSGNVNFNGHDVFYMLPEELRIMRKEFQIIFQDPYSSLNPRLKVGDSLMEPMQIHQIGKTKSERRDLGVHLLEEVGLAADDFEKYPHQFSGGQRQRICIARTLSMKPKFIVCDESVSALDVSIQAQILNLLLELKERYDLSYLFISHDISVIKFISDNVLVMKKGEIVERASAEDLYYNPKHPYTQKLIDAIYKF